MQTSISKSNNQCTHAQYDVGVIHNKHYATNDHRQPKIQLYSQFSLTMIRTHSHVRTCRRGSAEELDKAWLAVRIVSMLFKRALVEELETEGTRKVLGMPFLTHSSDALACRSRYYN